MNPRPSRFIPPYIGSWKPGMGGKGPKPETCAVIIVPRPDSQPARCNMALQSALHLRMLETVLLEPILSREGFRALGMPPCFGDDRDSLLRRAMGTGVTQSQFVFYLEEGYRCIPYWNRTLAGLLKNPQWDILVPRVVDRLSVLNPPAIPACAIYRRTLLQAVPWLGVGVTPSWRHEHWTSCRAAGARILPADTLQLEALHGAH